MTHRLGLLGFLCSWMVFALWAHEGGFPKATLSRVFPEAENFAARKKTLTVEQLKELARLTGGTPTAEDSDFTYYVAIAKDKSGRSYSLGAVFILHGAGPQGIIDMAVGLSPDLTVRGLVITENKNDPRIEKSEFLSQFKDKGPRDALALGRDLRFAGDRASAEALIKTVRKGMYLLGMVLKP